MIEPQDKRSKRLEDGSPVEIIETLLNSIHNYYNRQIIELSNTLAVQKASRYVH